MITLYHGSHEEKLEITDSGIFGGIFAAPSEHSALSHAPVLHVIEIDDSEILTQQELSYHVDYSVAKQIIAAELECTGDDLDRACELVIEDGMATDDDARIFKTEDAGYASWEAQRVRGVLARKLGYKAVEMNDEHGTTYLVLSGSLIRPASRPAASPAL